MVDVGGISQLPVLEADTVHLVALVGRLICGHEEDVIAEQDADDREREEQGEGHKYDERMLHEQGLQRVKKNKPYNKKMYQKQNKLKPQQPNFKL